MQIGRASGGQIAFFTFAALLILVPVCRFVMRANDWTPGQAYFLERFLSVLAIGTVLLAIPALRRWCMAQLRVAIPADARRETLIVTASGAVFAFAVVGALVLFRWAAEGPAGLAQWVRSWPSYDFQMGLALSATGLAVLLTSAVVGPVVEELVFRGMLYRAWEEKWGWFVAVLLSSVVFAVYHAGFWHAFMHGVIYAVLYRRTGTLLAPILAHGFYNAMMWYPALGHVVFNSRLDAPGDLGSWGFHLVCLGLISIAIPAYVFMGRTGAGSAVAPGHDPLPQ